MTQAKSEGGLVGDPSENLKHNAKILLFGQDNLRADTRAPTIGLENRNPSNWVALLTVVNDPLRFFGLVLLLNVSVLVGVAARTEALTQFTAVCGAVFVVMSVAAIVAFLTYFKPGALYGKDISRSIADQFCNDISGYWWSTRSGPDEYYPLGLLEIRPDPVTTAVGMRGWRYGRDGNLAARWEATASCVNVNDNRVFYHWKGDHPSFPNEPYEGIGEITFGASRESGSGMFFDLNLTDPKSATRRPCEYVRCTKQELKILRRPDDSKRFSDLIRVKLG